MLNLFDVLLLRKFGGSGGGTTNPNSADTITGTFAEPFGNVDFETLRDALQNYNATGMLWYSADGEEWNSSPNGYLEANQTYIFCDGGQAGTAVEDSRALSASWDVNGLNFARVLFGGSISDVAAFARFVYSKVFIIWHPMGD